VDFHPIDRHAGGRDGAARAAVDRISLQHSTDPEGYAMRSIPVGAKGSFSLVVKPDHLANRFKDATLPPVLATPVMVMAMENAALNAIKPYLDAGESAVGTRVDVRHLAATTAGRTVTATAEVTRAEGRQVAFRIDAFDGAERIGSGTHERMVIDLARFVDRLNANPA
jgi:fluoroacetyl-CoA thioesterase